MKYTSFLLAYLFILNSALAGLPPATIKGRKDAAKATNFNTEVPNKTATKIAGGHLIETGNKNILTNPSFEHSTASTGWTLTGGTFVLDNSPIDGVNNAQITASSASFHFSQDSVLYASQFADGVQGLAYVRVRTSVSSTPIYVCPRNAGSDLATSSCVIVQSNGKWGLYKVPFILGATSNGISIHSNGVSITGDIEIDDAFVGAQDVKQDTAFLTSQSTSFTAGSSGAGVTLTGTPTTIGSGNYTFSSGVFTALRDISVTMSCMTFNSGAATTQPTIIGLGSMTANSANAGGFAVNASSNGIVTAGSTFYCRNDSSTASSGVVRVLATNIVNSSTYSSTNADTDWQSCGHTTSDFTGFGTVTNIETQCKRQGSDLLIRGKFTAGTVTAVETRVALKHNGVVLTSANTSKIPSIQAAGDLLRNVVTSSDLVTLIEPSVGYVTFGYRNDGSFAPLTKLTGSNMGGSTFIFSQVRIPINGWENSNVIIGTFNEVVTTPGVSKPKTCYYAFGGASATLASPTVCSTGTCVEVYDSCGNGSAPTYSTTGYYLNFTIANNSFAANSFIDCGCKAFDAATGNARECNPSWSTGDQTWITTSSGGYVSDIFTSSSPGVATNTWFQIKCEGQAP